MKTFAMIALLSALATGASAHSRVDTTTPADGATLAAAPAEIALNFADDIRLTRVDLTHADQSAVQLDLGAQKAFGRAFTLPLGVDGPGAYRIEWRGLGQDGHAMQGAFSFTVE
ncbi:copper resistance CopC family protein [Actibacterium ureilyticum]|uniref:copper resistance CopC family protein n=1 Tax=Actibacterium ureilyticum TaxID=1590614 RepID=UPI000BAB2253|nr:copper resistance CopC family protein [Actibacterium ureilyticum]